MKTSTCVHLLAVLALCGCPLSIVVGDSPADGSSGGGEASGGSTTSGEPTTTAAGTTSTGEETTEAGTEETTEAGTSTGAGTGGSTGGAGTIGDSTGAASTGGDGGSTGGDDTLVLDPRTMEFFNLPINSIRYAAAGHDAEHGLCVSIIWFEPPPGEHCGAIDTMQFSPYVWIEPGSPPCMGWDYGPNVELTAGSGCYEWVSFEPPVAVLDLTLEVVGEPFSGTITVDNDN